MSVWGYPPAWKRARYVAEELGGRAFGGRSARFVGCTSAGSLLKYLTGLDVDLLVVGSDSVVNPGEGGDLRRRAVEQYMKWAEELGVKVRVISVPGMGLYYGWKFEGTPEAIFVDVFKAVWEGAEGASFIFLDLTHGLNFVIVSALYAVVAAAIGRGMENRLVLVNSEPYPADVEEKTCISAVRPPRVETTPELKILDVSGLQTVLQRVREVSALRNLTAVGRARCTRFGRMIWLMSNGAAALGFPGAIYDGWEPTFGPPEQPPRLMESRPVLENHVVRYEHQRAEVVVDVVMYQVWKELGHIFSGEAAASLVDYLAAVAREYERRGAIYISEVLKTATQEVALLQKVVATMYGLDAVVWPELWLAVWRHKEEVLKHLEDKSYVDILSESLAEAKKEVEEERRRLAERGVDQRTARNFLAHGGLSPAFIKRLELKNGKIARVVYDGGLVEKLVKYLEGRAPAC